MHVCSYWCTYQGCPTTQLVYNIESIESITFTNTHIHIHIRKMHTFAYALNQLLTLPWAGPRSRAGCASPHPPTPAAGTGPSKDLIRRICNCMLCVRVKSDRSNRGQPCKVMYACMHACMHARMHVTMHACMYVCMYVCMYLCMYVCMPVCMHCMYVYGPVRENTSKK